MAEAPTRYCGNCGRELRPEDRFCPNCRTPVHRAATVPTPEADVPVPAPLRQAGAAAPPPPQVGGEQRSWLRSHPLLTGCLGIMGIFLLLGIVGAIVDGGGETTPKLKATLQQDANGERMTFAFNDRFIYVMNSDGSNPTKLTEGGTPAWSPDGNRIAYTENLKEPNPAASCAPESVDAAPYTETPSVFLIGTNVRKQLLRRAAMEPAWSPDGKQIALTLDEHPKTYRGENFTSCGIYVMDADGSGKPRKLATGPGCASTPAWSPEGKKIAYTNGEGVDEEGYSVSNVYVANAPGEENGTDQPRALTDYSSGLAADPDWSPDGTEIAFSYADATGSPSVYKMDADGSGKTLIAPSLHLKKLEAASTGKEVTDGKDSPAWSPDGDRIAYVRRSPNCVPYPCNHDFVAQNEIHIIDSDGSNPTLERDFGKDSVGDLDWQQLR